MNNILGRIKELRDEVRKHDLLYEQNKPIITDSEYDELYLELERLEKEYPEFFDAESPTQKITTSVITGLNKVVHSTPMLSQDKITSMDGVEDFLKRHNGDILIQQKLDGVTVVAIYENGRMINAASRGNGEIGEDITHTVKCFNNMPKVIPFKGRLEIRLEAVIPYDDFERTNKDGSYSNPRNFVSGQIRRLDNAGIKEMGIKAIAFDLIYAEGIEFEKDIDRIMFLSKQGFEVVETAVFYNDAVEDIEDYINQYETVKRDTLPHMIDGLVLKFQDLSIRDVLGTTSKHPRWAIAYKFKSMNATTKLLDVTWQVGKMGQITPVAELETVTIDSVNISRATLHNYGNILTKDIRIGDTVIVKRANDVIPHIEGVVKDLRDGTEKVIESPKVCPYCSETVEFEGENLFCNGLDCQPQIEGKLKHYVSRNAMNIDGLGQKAIEMFYREGIISSIIDIYKLKVKEDQICQLEGFGKKKFDKIIDGVEASKTLELNNFLYGLAIKNIGQSASRDLANEFKTMDELLDEFSKGNSFRERILSIPDFGNIMADSLINFLSHPKNIKIIRTIQGFGVNMSEKVVEIAENNKINGKTFVVTGSVEQFKNRDELKKKIEEMGGKVAGSVSKNTNYLINNDNASASSKNKKALELNIPIITEKEFMEML